MSSTPSSSVSLRYPSLLHWAVAVLNTHDSIEKSTLTLEAFFLYNKGELPLFACDDSLDEAFPQVPEKPARPLHLTTLPPKDMPPAKKGIENHEWNKLRLIHSLAHIESYAIDLSLDILVRFATRKNVGRESTEGVPMPEAFYRDWLRIAAEEAKHFSSVDKLQMTRVDKDQTKYEAKQRTSLDRIGLIKFSSFYCSSFAWCVESL